MYNAKRRRQRERRKKQKSVGVIGEKKTFFERAAHFFVHFFAVVVVTWNFRVPRLMEKTLYVVTKKFVACIAVRFFFLFRTRHQYGRVISMEFLRSFLWRHFAGKPVVESPNVGCFLKLG